MRHINEIDHALREVKQAQQERRDRGVDLVVDRKRYLDMTNEEVHTELRNTFPERSLYDMSTDWRKSGEYILKAKGAHGDVIVGWEGRRYV